MTSGALRETLFALTEGGPMTAEDIANYLGVTTGMIFKYRNGENMPSLDKAILLSKIASSFDVDALANAASAEHKRAVPIPQDFEPNLSSLEERTGVYDATGEARHHETLFDFASAKRAAARGWLYCKQLYLEYEAMEAHYAGAPTTRSRPSMTADIGIGDGLPNHILPF